mgnify:CR=1 FL=1
MDTIESITKQIMDDPRDAEFTKRGEKPVFSAPEIWAARWRPPQRGR